MNQWMSTSTKETYQGLPKRSTQKSYTTETHTHTYNLAWIRECQPLQKRPSKEMYAEVLYNRETHTHLQPCMNQCMLTSTKEAYQRDLHRSPIKQTDRHTPRTLYEWVNVNEDVHAFNKDSKLMYICIYKYTYIHTYINIYVCMYIYI